MDSIYVNRHRADGDDPGVCFVNEEKQLCKQIVDREGNLRQFPGVDVCPTLSADCASYRWEPILRYEMTFGDWEQDKLAVLWTIRPAYFDPGDEWGFGREEWDQVQLYSYLDENGDYTQPFRLVTNP